MEIWKTLLAPLFVALVGGYFLRDIQQPSRAAISAELNWIDTTNPLVSLDVKKAYEASGILKTDPAALGKLHEVASEYLVVRFVSIKIKNDSKLMAKATEVSLPKGGVLLWSNDNRRPVVGLKWTGDTLAPGSEHALTAIIRPQFSDFDPGVLIVHEGRKVEPWIGRASEDQIWTTTFMNSHPAIFIFITLFSFFSGLLVLTSLALALYVGKDLERKTLFTTSKDAKEAVRFANYLQEKRPDKLE